MPRRRSKRPIPGLLGWALLLFFALLTFLAALWVLRPLKEPPPRRVRPPLKLKYLRRPPKRNPPQRVSLPPKTPKPLAAIIIDDMGQRPALEKKFFSLGLRLNFSFLPYAPFTPQLAKEAHERGFEVLVHLPLEAGNHEQAKGMISLKMGREETKRRMRQAIARVPFAVGVNHHEGSKFTENKLHTRWLLEEVASLGLFYVDSRTTPKTVVPQVARSLGLPFAERRVFLDHRVREEEVEKAIERFILRAKRKGPTVAIGHPHEATLKALRAKRERLKKELELVPMSEFIRRTRRGS